MENSEGFKLFTLSIEAQKFLITNSNPCTSYPTPIISISVTFTGNVKHVTKPPRYLCQLGWLTNDLIINLSKSNDLIR